MATCRLLRVPAHLLISTSRILESCLIKSWAQSKHYGKVTDRIAVVSVSWSNYAAALACKGRKQKQQQHWPQPARPSAPETQTVPLLLGSQPVLQTAAAATAVTAVKLLCPRWPPHNSCHSMRDCHQSPTHPAAQLPPPLGC
jgi:hypothetical protein